MRTTRTLTLIGGAAAALLTIAVIPSAAFATGTVGTATLSQGALSYVTPATIRFGAVLNGINQIVGASQRINVVDGSGSAAGWTLTVTSTTFKTGRYELPNNSAFDRSVAGACDTGVTCTLANNSATSYPVLIPAAKFAPTAVRIMSAAAGSGMGGQTWTNQMRLAINGNTRAGVYTSTWIYSLVSAP
jgi:hypothetical protein